MWCMKVNDSDFFNFFNLAGCIVCLVLIGCSTIDIHDKERTDIEQYNGSWIGVFEETETVRYQDFAYGARGRFTCNGSLSPIKARSLRGRSSATANAPQRCAFS